jgi:hypothetical protein
MYPFLGLASFTKIVLSFIYVVNSFLVTAWIYHNVHACTLIYEHVGYFLLQTKLLGTFLCKFLYELTLSFLVVKDLRMECLGHVEVIYLLFAKCQIFLCLCHVISHTPGVCESSSFCTFSKIRCFFCLGHFHRCVVFSLWF